MRCSWSRFDHAGGELQSARCKRTPHNVVNQQNTSDRLRAFIFYYYKKEILLTCTFETGVWKLVTSVRQELLLRMMLATTPDMPLSLRSGRDEQACLGARDMLGCASQLPACHVFTTRDFQRLSTVYLSKISQLPVCHLLLSNFRNMTSFHCH